MALAKALRRGRARNIGGILALVMPRAGTAGCGDRAVAYLMNNVWAIKKLVMAVIF
jgi:hypothetical protein